MFFLDHGLALASAANDGMALVGHSKPCIRCSWQKRTGYLLYGSLGSYSRSCLTSVLLCDYRIAVRVAENMRWAVRK